MRSFLVGLLLLVFISVTVLSLRPGGLRRQLRFAARRLRLALVLAGAYLVASTVVRIFWADGALGEWGPPVLAVGLAVVYLVLAQDPSARQAAPAPKAVNRP